MPHPVHAPEIDRPGLTWLNTPQPLGLDQLAGRLVILDFWTFCCINCIQVLPTLARIEAAWPEQVAVIGVHSPKFAAERDPANVASAIARHGIRHPVIHDPDMELWRRYAVRAWPTLVLISPTGHVIGSVSGEPDPERLMEAIAGLLDEHARRGEMTPRALAPAPEPEPGGRLRFPGKIKPLAWTDGGRRWAVADAGHNQVVLLDDDGAEVRRYGGGEAGLVDGPAAACRFAAPQGLIGGPGALFVADTGNHAIRRIDLGSGEVSTLAGTGRRGLPLGARGDGRRTALASPWDLELDGEALFFANAGSHQLGVLDLNDGAVRALAGTGGEDIVDGPAGAALLAQPSGLALDRAGETLYFADSETSSIRRLNLGGKRAGRVETLIGTGLFDFGRRNGPLDSAQLQHPLGVALVDGDLVVADSYNGTLRRIELAAGTVTDFDDGRFLCLDPLCRPLREPAGVAWDGEGRLLVADTNNHRIVAYALEADRRTSFTWFI